MPSEPLRGSVGPTLRNNSLPQKLLQPVIHLLKSNLLRVSPARHEVTLARLNPTLPRYSSDLNDTGGLGCARLTRRYRVTVLTSAILRLVMRKVDPTLPRYGSDLVDTGSRDAQG